MRWIEWLMVQLIESALIGEAESLPSPPLPLKWLIAAS